MLSFKDDMLSFKDDMLSFKEEMYAFKNSTTKTLANHTVALINIESKLDMYADMFYSNKENIKYLDQRVTNLENR